MEAVEFELGVAERLLIISMLPPQGDITMLKQFREFREILSFSDDERKEFGLESSGDDIKWVSSKPVTKTIPSPFMEIIKEALNALNRKKQLTEDHIPLYDLFVGDG